MANQYPTSNVCVTTATDSSGKLSTSTATTTYSYASPVVVKAASYGVQASDSGTIFTTTGASGAVAFTLPAVQAGLSFTFVATAAQSTTIVGATGTIKGAGSLSGTTLTISAGTGSVTYTTVKLVSDGTYWYVTEAFGTIASVV